MKLNASILLVFVGLSLGCASAEKEPEVNNTRVEINQPSGKPGADWNSKKDQFINQSDKRVREIKSEVAGLQKAKTNLKSEQRRKADGVLDETNGLLKDVTEELSDLKKVDEEEWEEQRLEFLSKLNQLEERFTSAKSVIK